MKIEQLAIYIPNEVKWQNSSTKQIAHLPTSYVIGNGKECPMGRKSNSYMIRKDIGLCHHYLFILIPLKLSLLMLGFYSVILRVLIIKNLAHVYTFVIFLRAHSKDSTNLYNS